MRDYLYYGHFGDCFNLFVAGVTAGAGIWPINILSQYLCMHKCFACSKACHASHIAIVLTHMHSKM